MKLFLSILAVVGILASQSALDARLNTNAIPGSYISKAFCTTDHNGNFYDIRNELLVLHNDGTAARYISTAIGSTCVYENGNNIELTPSFGTWKISDCGEYVHAVFFDFFNQTDCSEQDECAGGQFAVDEYDRITYTITFDCKSKDKYQIATANEYLIGILLSSTQNPNAPLDSLICPGSCDPTTLETYNDPFLALQSFDELKTNNLIDPTTLYNGLPLLRTNIQFYRINVEKDFLFPPVPTP